jgi:hypothetical protein
MTPNNSVTPSPVKSSGNTTSKKSDGSTLKSTYTDDWDWCGNDGTSIC